MIGLEFPHRYFAVTQDDRQDVAKVMSHADYEMADDLHFLRFDELRLKLLDQYNIMPVFRDHDGVAMVGFDRSDAHCYVNEGAVFAPTHCVKRWHCFAIPALFHDAQVFFVMISRE